MLCGQTEFAPESCGLAPCPPPRDAKASPDAPVLSIEIGPQNRHVKPMLIARRYLIGSILCAVAIGGALALDRIGSAAVREPLTVQFARGTTLAPGEGERLSAFVGAHIAEPRLTVHILGHTGQRGEAAANLALSQERADAVAALLLEAGLEQSQILSVQGAGAAEPLDAMPGESSGALQRRMSRAVVTPVLRK